MTTHNGEPITICCSACGTSRQAKPTANGLPRLPTGWHRVAERLLCSRCWSQRYILRAVIFPVTGPVGRDWKDLRVAFASCWAQSTGLANWCVTELAKADVIRMPNEGSKMPAMPRLYLYPEARRRFPEMSVAALTAVLHTTESRYRKARLEVIWRCQASLPRYRYPVPYAVSNQAWKAHYGSENVPLLDVPLAGERWTLRLDRWWNRRRQLLSFDKIVSGEAVKGQVAVYRVRANRGDHRSGMKESSPGSGPAVHYRIMAKIWAWLPRSADRPRQGVLKVNTAPDCLWRIDGEPWLYADHVRRWCAVHDRFLKQVAVDFKYEKRWPKRARGNLNAYRAQRCHKFRQRIYTAIQEWTTQLVNHVDRRGIAELHYNDAERSYLRNFAWCQLAQLLRQKAEERGIRMLLEGSAKMPEKQQVSHGG